MSRTLRSDLAAVRTRVGTAVRRRARTGRDGARPGDACSGGARPGGGARARLGARLHAAAAAFSQQWSRSLQLRVVLTTILLGGATMFFVGAYMQGRIVEGLTAEKIAAATTDAAARAAAAQRAFDSTDKTDDASLRQLAYETVQGQVATDHSREVLMLPVPDAGARRVVLPAVYQGVAPADVPADLRRAVAADPRVQRVQVLTLPVNGHRVPTVVVGSVLVLPPAAGRAELYFAYPMTGEATALRIVTQNLAAAAVLLVLLLGAIALVVTRIVVDPVRRAAQVAERLAGGELAQRMAVRGTDDIAVLGRSFNRMAGSLQTQIGQLEGLSRVQQQFVSDVSHELRTPLTTVRMAADLLYDSREDFTPVAARSTELLATELNRFEALLADLLEISRYDAGAATFDPEQGDLLDVVRRVVDGAQVLADRRGSELVVVAPPGPVLVDMDRKRIERILRNLVVNAVEHGEGRPVVVEVGVGEQAVAVAVRDRGIGLEPGQAALVFTRFWRADPARARTTGGTGLGLAIALEDAHLHGGWLEAWGQPGVGSCFRLTLPRTAGTTLTTSPLAMQPPGTRVNPPPAPRRLDDAVPGTALPGTAVPGSPAVPGTALPGAEQRPNPSAPSAPGAPGSS